MTSHSFSVFAAYWPQWHPTPLNDYWFGDNYTDWELLCNNQWLGGGSNDLGDPLMGTRRDAFACR